MKVLKVNKEDRSICMKEDFEGITISTKWRPYMVGDLPVRFGCRDFGTRVYDENNQLFKIATKTQIIHMSFLKKGGNSAIFLQGDFYPLKIITL